ncbi:MAG TPA: hypothetical protein VGL82_04655 [Bryobacteraceae bacterium]|jgi:hypothetical protein
MRGELILAFLPLALMGQIQPVRTVTSQAQRVGGGPVAGFQNGFLFFLDDRATVRVYSPEGFPVLATVLQIPHADDIWAKGFAIDTDGTFAVGVAYGTSARAGGIAFYNKYGQPDGFVATGSYLPESLCFAEDHSLWTFGSQRGGGDYMMVRHFTADRKDASQFLARSLFPKGLDPGMGHWQTRRIIVTQHRVGLFAFSGNNGNLNEWVELDLSGNLVRRIRLDQQDFTPMAFTEDGHLYRKPDYKSALEVLSQTTSDWQDLGMATLEWLLGADGNSLVFSPGRLGPMTMQWFDQPAAPGNQVRPQPGP